MRRQQQSSHSYPSILASSGLLFLSLPSRLIQPRWMQLPFPPAPTPLQLFLPLSRNATENATERISLSTTPPYSSFWCSLCIAHRSHIDSFSIHSSLRSSSLSSRIHAHSARTHAYLIRSRYAVSSCLIFHFFLQASLFLSSLDCTPGYIRPGCAIPYTQSIFPSAFVEWSLCFMLC
jgi:hypothetical protein